MITNEIILRDGAEATMVNLQLANQLTACAVSQSATATIIDEFKAFGRWLICPNHLFKKGVLCIDLGVGRHGAKVIKHLLWVTVNCNPFILVVETSLKTI